MSKTIGGMIRQARQKKFKTHEGTEHALAFTKGQRTELAKKLAMTSAYLGHLENDSHVTLSPRVVDRLEQVLGLKLPAPLVEKHNDKARKWYKAYNASRKPAKKVATKKAAAKPKTIRRPSKAKPAVVATEAPSEPMPAAGV